MIPLIVLTGPTTSGKSKTALALAKKLNTEIISADSMQVYKYFDIGSAKPSEEERQRIPHHLIDILEPDEEFNAFDFKTSALKSIHNLMNRNKIPILVGGTALYLKVLIQDYDCAVQISEKFRKTKKCKVHLTLTHSLLPRVPALHLRSVFLMGRGGDMVSPRACDDSEGVSLPSR